jgi:hypothetical protein
MSFEMLVKKPRHREASESFNYEIQSKSTLLGTVDRDGSRTCGSRLCIQCSGYTPVNLGVPPWPIQFSSAVSTVGMSTALLCLPGLVPSMDGLFRTPRRLAVRGVALGVFGSLYLPTIYFSILH